MNKYQYYATTRLGTRQLNPLGKLQYSYGKQAEDMRRGYVKTFTGKLTFIGEDFNWLYALERTNYRCEAVSLSIWKYCGGMYQEDWQLGKISFNKCEWDLDRHSVTVTITPDDKYSCYEDHKDEAINLLIEVPNNEIVTLASGNIEYLSFVITNGVPGSGPFPPDPALWTRYHDKIEYTGTDRIEHADYARYNLGGGLYQPALIFAPVLVTDGISSELTYSIYTDADSIDNGMKLQDAVEVFLSQFCNDITLKSDFFQWNPDNSSDDNYVTGELSKTKNLILFQKSDVKRPNVSNNATIGEITFADLLNNICKIYNCLWDIDDDGSAFRIEHYSYWQSADGLDLTLDTYKKYTTFKRKYSYQVDSMPKFEHFKFMEADGFDFIGTDIWYDSACVTTDQTNKDKSYEADKITTDVSLVMSNPEADSKIVSDDGFVLVACYDTNMIISEAPILDSAWQINNSLAWAQLHRDYWKYGRVLLHGYMNRALTDFVSSIKTKLQEKISIPLCCGDTFNPDDLVTTNLTDEGQVSKATFELHNDMLTLEVLFDANQDLFINHAPIANPDSAVCTENSFVVIDVATNDTDEDGNLVPGTVEITSDPANGVAVANGDGTITYTPNADYNGADFFYYTIKDAYNEPSASAVVSITVTAIATAVNDAYNAFKNETLSVGISGVLANDAGPGITVTSYDVASVHGGTVTVNANGSFSYTPALNYTGPDSFNYTITDSGANTSTGTVNLNVQVRATVYAKIVTTQVSRASTNGNCNPAGYVVHSDVKVYFYSNAGGTISFNVTGYGITVNYRRAEHNNHTSADSHTDLSFAATGTSYAVASNAVTHLSLYNCDGSYGGTDYDDVYSLLTGFGYTII